MSTAQAPQRTDLKAMLQELKSNGRTQVALLVFAGTLTWLLWPEAAPVRPLARGTKGPAAPTALDPRQYEALDRMLKLGVLDKAGELPPMPKQVRDLFLFEAPAPPAAPVKPPPPPPPPKPPTPEELEAQRLAGLRAQEDSTKPSQLRYLGFLRGNPSGLIGAFMKGEEPITVPLGQMVGRWKLVKVSDTAAEFQNQTYADMRYTLQARDSSGAASSSGASNEF